MNFQRRDVLDFFFDFFYGLPHLLFISPNLSNHMILLHVWSYDWISLQNCDPFLLKHKKGSVQYLVVI